MAFLFSQESDYIDFNVESNDDAYPSSLFIHTMGAEPRYMAIIDSTLNPYWFVNAGQLGLDFKVNHEKISYFDKTHKSWIIVNEYMVEIDTLECINGYTADYHDMIVLPNGGYHITGI